MGLGSMVLICAASFMTSMQSSLASAETLEDAWQAALGSNREHSAAERSTEAAALGVEAAKHLRWPSVGVEVGYTQLNETPAARAAVPFAGQMSSFVFPTQQSGYGNMSSIVSVPLFTSGQIPAAIDAASATSRASQEELRRTDLDLALQVATAYVEHLRAEKLLSVVLSTESSLRAHRDDVQRLLTQGIVARNDELAAEVALADAEQRTLEARTQLDLARAAYNRLLQRPLDSAVVLEDLDPAAARRTLDQLTTVALEQRPELRALTAESTALQREADRTAASIRPQLIAQGGYSYEENRYRVPQGLWSLGLGVRWPLFDGGVARAQSGSLRAQARSLEERTIDVQSRIAVEVRERHLELFTARERLNVAARTLEQADENLRVSRDRYRAGTGTNTEVLDADTLRQRAYVNFYSARYDAVLAGFRLRRATGALATRGP
jgi:outer membrane protein